jgi:hypothetical protein
VNAQSFVNQINRHIRLDRHFLSNAETFIFLPDRSLQVATACDNAVLNSQQLEVDLDNNWGAGPFPFPHLSNVVETWLAVAAVGGPKPRWAALRESVIVQRESCGMTI